MGERKGEIMRIPPFSRKAGQSAGRDALRRAVRATRRTAGETVLSAPARDRILDAARIQAEQPMELFPSLFTAPRRLLVVGALPLILAMGLLVLLNQDTTVAPDLGDPSLQVSKQNGQVFFRIANGSRDHVVYRSTVPDSFDGAAGVTVKDGSFSDPIDDHANLVFYRID